LRFESLQTVTNSQQLLMLSDAKIDALLLRCLEGFQGQQGLEGQFATAH